MATMTEVIEIFARSIAVKAGALRSLALTRRQRARLREAISVDIRKCTDLFAPFASRAAVEKAKEAGIDLLELDWHQRRKLGDAVHQFILEHFITVKTLVSLCVDAQSVEEIVRVLSNARVVWILAAENEVLNDLGCRCDRSDPQRAYQEAGIELIEALSPHR